MNQLWIEARAATKTGVYHVDFTITQAGRHFWEFAGTGALVQLEESSFVALRSNT